MKLVSAVIEIYFDLKTPYLDIFRIKIHIYFAMTLLKKKNSKLLRTQSVVFFSSDALPIFDNVSFTLNTNFMLKFRYKIL